jgi:hypothetical protein
MDRSVANMNDEQLHRKRAFDRVNQRASRARKKSRITELEEEAADLKRRLIRSEGLVKQLQSNEKCLREIIESARVSLQMADHHVVSPIDRDESLSSAGAVLDQDQSLTGAGLDSSQTSISPLSSLRTDPPLEFVAHPLFAGQSNVSATIETPAYGATSNEGVLLRDAGTGLILELPVNVDESPFNMWEGSPGESRSLQQIQRPLNAQFRDQTQTIHTRCRSLARIQRRTVSVSHNTGLLYQISSY